MKKGLLSLTAMIVLTALSWQAHAVPFHFAFSGPGVGGDITIDYGTTPDAKYPKAFQISGISGTFSDTHLGISNAPILGLEPLNRVSPEPSNLLAPNDFSAYAVATGLGPESNGFLHYDNLFYPEGSPQTASDYPFHGGVLDIYGLLFDIGGGAAVNLWSNGTLPGSQAPDYGVAVANHALSLDYTGAGVTIAQTPEPGTFCLVASGFAAVLSRRRFLRKT